MLKPAFFLDRDGTLSHEVGYVNHVSRFQLFPWAVDAVRTINRAGWLAVVVTNQAGAAHGYFPESLIQEVNETMRLRAARAAARLRVPQAEARPRDPRRAGAGHRRGPLLDGG